MNIFGFLSRSEPSITEEWRKYWGQFIDDPKQLKRITDPVQMGHLVVTGLAEENVKLKRANRALAKGIYQLVVALRDRF